MRRPFCVGLILLALAGCSGAKGGDWKASNDAGDGKILAVPAQGALLGALPGAVSVGAFETMIGRSLAIRHSFHDWNGNFIGDAATSDIQAGRIPLITWQPIQEKSGIPLDDIIGGTYDDMIQTRAQQSRQASKPILLRWGHEMNGDWFPWGGVKNGANAEATQKYIAAYRHVHDIFTAEGASNVLWVFCPNADSVPDSPWNDWTQYYPGDDYVDWTGFDGYNWGTTQSYGSKWQEFSDIAAPIYPGLATKGKPIIVAETASTEIGGNKAAWIAGIVPALQSSYPQIRALTWFNAVDIDWPIDTSPQSLAAFRVMAEDTYFNPI